MKVLFLTRHDRMGSSSRYRCFQFIPYLQINGWQCDISSLFSDDYLVTKYSRGRVRLWEAIRCYIKRIGALQRVNQYDLIVIEKELFPYVPLFIEKIFMLWKTPFVLDIDDAIYHKYDTGQPWIIKQLLKDKIGYLMQRAATVITGNPYLSSYAMKVGERVVEIPIDSKVIQ
jgi:hypothetical protein